MADYMYYEAEGVTFRKSTSADSDVVTKKLGDAYTNAFADLTIKNDEEKFKIACEKYLERLSAAAKKQATATPKAESDDVGENLTDENDV